MGPPAGAKDVVFHGLGVDAHAVSAVLPDGPELLRVQGVRAAALYGKFHAAAKIKGFPKGVQEPDHLGGGQGGGGAAADVQGAKVLAAFFHQLRCDPDFFFQSRQVWLQKLGFLADGAADEAAVGAAGGAEGDAHIDGNVLRLHLTYRVYRGQGTVHRQFPPFLRDVVHILHELVGGLWRAALKQVLCCDFGGPNSRQSAPGGSLRQQLDGGQVVALLQNPAAQTHRFLRCLQAAGSGGGSAVQRDFRGGGEVGSSPVEGGFRLAVRVVGKQRHLKLLHSVTVVVTDACQIHRDSSWTPCRAGCPQPAALKTLQSISADKDYTSSHWPAWWILRDRGAPTGWLRSGTAA